MPIYTFICKNKECKHEFDEVYCSWDNDTTKQKCPKCKRRTKKIPSVNARMKANWSQWDAV